MFGIISSNECLKEVRTLCAYQEYPLLQIQVGEDINVRTLEKKELSDIDKLIVEITKNDNDFLDWIIKVKESHPNLQVIIFFNNDLEIQNEYIEKLIEVKIYDLIKTNQKEDIQDHLYDAIIHPCSERKARKLIKEDKKKEEKYTEELEYIVFENYDIDDSNEIEEYEQEEHIDEDKEVYEENEEEFCEENGNTREKKLPFQITLPQMPQLTRKEVVEKTVTVFKEKIVGTIIIALAGTQTRIGVSHMAIGLAKFLSNKGHNVALAEDGNTFNDIEVAYKDIKEVEMGYVLDGITFYKSLNVSEILQRNHNYIILDLGNYLREDFKIEEFNRATKKILISGAKDWEFKYLEIILETVPTLYLETYTYLFNFCDDETLDFIKENMPGMNVMKSGYNPNPFEISIEAEGAMKELVQEVLPDETSRKRKFFQKGK